MSSLGIFGEIVFELCDARCALRCARQGNRSEGRLLQRVRGAMTILFESSMSPLKLAGAPLSLLQTISIPSFSIMVTSAMSGKPISALGSSPSMEAIMTIPSPSDFALPAQ